MQSDRVDKCAVGFNEPSEKVGTNYIKSKPDVSGAKPSALRARFENMAKENEEEAQKKIKEERDRRLKLEKMEREADANRNDVIFNLFYYRFFYVVLELIKLIFFRNSLLKILYQDRFKSYL